MEWIVNINFWGVVYGTKAFLPRPESRPEAAIINISSILALLPTLTGAAYNATKFAVRGFTESLRQELAGTECFVTTVHPGGIKTNIVRNGRMKTSLAGPKKITLLRLRNSEDALPALGPGLRMSLSSGVKQKRRILIGADARLMDRIQRWFPVRYSGIFRLGAEAGIKTVQFRRKPASDSRKSRFVTKN